MADRYYSGADALNIFVGRLIEGKVAGEKRRQEVEDVKLKGEQELELLKTKLTYEKNAEIELFKAKNEQELLNQKTRINELNTYTDDQLVNFIITNKGASKEQNAVAIEKIRDPELKGRILKTIEDVKETSSIEAKNYSQARYTEERGNVVADVAQSQVYLNNSRGALLSEQAIYEQQSREARIAQINAKVYDVQVSSAKKLAEVEIDKEKNILAWSRLAEEKQNNIDNIAFKYTELNQRKNISEADRDLEFKKLDEEVRNNQAKNTAEFKRLSDEFMFKTKELELEAKKVKYQRDNTDSLIAERAEMGEYRRAELARKNVELTYKLAEIQNTIRLRNDEFKQRVYEFGEKNRQQLKVLEQTNKSREDIARWSNESKVYQADSKANTEVKKLEQKESEAKRDYDIEKQKIFQKGEEIATRKAKAQAEIDRLNQEIEESKQKMKGMSEEDKLNQEKLDEEKRKNLANEENTFRKIILEEEKYKTESADENKKLDNQFAVEQEKIKNDRVKIENEAKEAQDKINIKQKELDENSRQFRERINQDREEFSKTFNLKLLEFEETKKVNAAKVYNDGELMFVNRALINAKTTEINQKIQETERDAYLTITEKEARIVKLKGEADYLKVKVDEGNVSITSKKIEAALSQIKLNVAAALSGLNGEAAIASFNTILSTNTEISSKLNQLKRDKENAKINTQTAKALIISQIKTLEETAKLVDESSGRLILRTKSYTDKIAGAKTPKQKRAELDEYLTAMSSQLRLIGKKISNKMVSPEDIEVIASVIGVHQFLSEQVVVDGEAYPSWYESKGIADSSLPFIGTDYQYRRKFDELSRRVSGMLPSMYSALKGVPESLREKLLNDDRLNSLNLTIEKLAKEKESIIEQGSREEAKLQFQIRDLMDRASGNVKQISILEKFLGGR